MPLLERPRYLLEPQAYTDGAWFDVERRALLDTTWHRGSEGTTLDHWAGLDFSSNRPSEPLEAALGALPRALGSVQPERLVEVASVDLEGEFNWKLFIENHLDVLHLWYLHDRSLGSFDHARFEHRQLGRNWASYEPLRAGQPRPTGSLISHLEERDVVGLGAHLLFPDTPMAAAADFFLTYRARPVAADRTVVELRVLAEPGADPDPLVRASLGFIEEDMEACARIQHVLWSRHFRVGPLAATHEQPIVAFQRNVIDYLEGALP